MSDPKNQDEEGYCPDEGKVLHPIFMITRAYRLTTKFWEAATAVCRDEASGKIFELDLQSNIAYPITYH